MGNAYFHSAFIENNQYEDLKFALNSYNCAEKYQEKEIKNPDLFYKRGVVHAYLENYEKAFLDFKIADSIDKNLNAENISQNILNYVINTNKAIKNSCAIKSKKLIQILNNIPVNLKDDVNFKLSSLDKLNKGENKGVLISSKAVLMLEKSLEVPL